VAEYDIANVFEFVMRAVSCFLFALEVCIATITVMLSLHSTPTIRPIPDDARCKDPGHRQYDYYYCCEQLYIT